VAVEERVGILERAVLEPQETPDVPGPDVRGARVDVDGEVEVVAHRDAHLPVRAGTRRLEHVEALDDEDVRAPHGDAGAGDDVVGVVRVDGRANLLRDRKSTRLNSSHVSTSYAVFCLKKKKIDQVA